MNAEARTISNGYTVTYSPDDNKLRLYSVSRLPPDIYARIKSAGFRWAPKQELFFATWSTAAEDIALELAGEIGDEDTSLVERAEERAERFEGYSERRMADAESASKAVSAIADGIPFGQPILVGHHSEKHARRDAERIESGMRKAVKMWETSKYWTDRAAGALRHAKYKERPDVRARRIKGLEADARKQAKIIERSRALLKVWADPLAHLKRKDGAPLTLRAAVIYIANRDGGYWASEYQRPNGYNGPMSLWDAAGGNIHDQDPETVAIATPEQICAKAIENHTAVIAHHSRWLAHFENRLAYERAMLAEAGGTAADKTGPEVGGGCRCWASPRGGWSYIQKVNRVTVTVLDNWGNGGANFTRTIPFDKLAAVMSKAQVEEARAADRLYDTEDKLGFILADRPTPKQPEPKAPAGQFEQMRESLREGVKVVSAPQLFPTPVALAERMIALADIRPGDRVLEPSAGTGRLIGAMGGKMFAPAGFAPAGRGAIVAVEVNANLAERLRSEFPLTDVRCADFLSCAVEELGTFDRIVMNPPFSDGADVEHVTHALAFLKPGGRLVAVMSAGVTFRQDKRTAALREVVEASGTIEPLPEDSFKESGTAVRTVLVVIDR